MQFLKADTSVKAVIGPVVAVGDGFTPVTTLSLSTADEAELLKHDAATVTDISSNTFAAITDADGYYNLTFTAGQLDTEGMLTILVNDDSLCLPVKKDFMVVSANVYDSLFAAAGTDVLNINVAEISENSTAADNAELAFDGTGYGFTGCTMPTVTTLTGHTAQTGDSFAQIGVAGAGLTDLGGMSTAMQAEVNAEVVDVMSVDTHEALSGVPGDPATYEEMLTWVTHCHLDQVRTNSTTNKAEVYNPSGVLIADADISDNGTEFIRQRYT